MHTLPVFVVATNTPLSENLVTHVADTFFSSFFRDGVWSIQKLFDCYGLILLHEGATYVIYKVLACAISTTLYTVRWHMYGYVWRQCFSCFSLYRYTEIWAFDHISFIGHKQILNTLNVTTWKNCEFISDQLTTDTTAQWVNVTFGDKVVKIILSSILWFECIFQGPPPTFWMKLINARGITLIVITPYLP